jgi:hypothetical protein
MSVGVMKDKKIKMKDLHASHTFASPEVRVCGPLLLSLY